MVLAAASPPQEKAERSGKRGFGVAAPGNRAEVSEVHKQLIGSAKQQALRRRKPSAAGSGGSGAAAPDFRAEVSEVHKHLIGSVKH